MRLMDWPGIELGVAWYFQAIQSRQGWGHAMHGVDSGYG